MCLECEKEVLSHIKSGSQLKTAKGKRFTITRIDDRNIYYELESSGKKRHVCIEHLAMCYHRMKVSGKKIEGVGGSNSYSVRELVGKGGKLADCGNCERNPAYIWGILSCHPKIRRLEKGELVFDEVALDKCTEYEKVLNWKDREFRIKKLKELGLA